MSLTDRDIACVLRISGVASSTSDPVVAAEEILDLFRSIVPYAAASISAWNPLTGRHESLASVGYPVDVQTHLDTWFVEHDEVFRWMRTVDPRPLRWRDMPFDYRSMHSARDVFVPAGFDEGVTTCLYTCDGRYTGSFHVSTDVRALPSDDAMDALCALQVPLAGVADGLRTPGWLAAALQPLDNAAVVTKTGMLLVLPDRPAGPHLTPGGPLVEAVLAVFGANGGIDRFLWRDDAGLWHRVRLHVLAGGALVTEAPCPRPLNLTAREIDVLTLLAAGRSNPEIAEALTIAVKTASKHVEHVLEKLGCASRAAAAARAVQDGLICLPGT